MDWTFFENKKRGADKRIKEWRIDMPRHPAKSAILSRHEYGSPSLTEVPGLLEAGLPPNGDGVPEFTGFTHQRALLASGGHLASGARAPTPAARTSK